MNDRMVMWKSMLEGMRLNYEAVSELVGPRVVFVSLPYPLEELRDLFARDLVERGELVWSVLPFLQELHPGLETDPEPMLGCDRKGHEPATRGKLGLLPHSLTPPPGAGFEARRALPTRHDKINVQRMLVAWRP